MNSLWGLADQIVLSALGFAAILIVARGGAASEVGLFAIANSIIVLAITLQDSLLTRPYSIQIFRPPGHPASHAAGVLSLSLIVAFMIATALIVLMIANLVFPVADVRLILALAISLPFILTREFARRHGLANMRMYSSFLIDAVAAGVSVASMGLLLSQGWLTAANALLALGAGAAASVATWWLKNASQFSFDRSTTKRTAQQSWSLGKWLLASQLAMQIQGYAAHWLTFLLLGASVTGHYAAALSVVALANPVVFGFFNLLMPKSVRTLKNLGHSALRRQVWSDIAALTAMMLGFTLFVYVEGGLLLQILYPQLALQENGALGSIAVILSLAATVGAAGGPAAIALQGMEQGRLLAAVSAVICLCGITCTWVLTSAYGIAGAATGLLVTEVIGCAIRLGLFERLARIAPA